jgi:hypothetical protein
MREHGGSRGARPAGRWAGAATFSGVVDIDDGRSWFVFPWPPVPRLPVAVARRVNTRPQWAAATVADGGGAAGRSQ